MYFVSFSFFPLSPQGADMVEFDIHVTKDRVPVIGHDFQAILNAVSCLGNISLSLCLSLSLSLSL